MKSKLLVAVCAIGMALAFAGCGGNAGGSSQESSPLDSTSACTHTYDNDCDVNCNECGETRTPSAHVYDNACDADCNECDETRIPSDHVYDNACDAVCNVCGATREISDHVYDNEYDAKCNVCGNERDVPEDPVNGGNWTGEVPLK